MVHVQPLEHVEPFDMEIYDHSLDQCFMELHIVLKVLVNFPFYQVCESQIDPHHIGQRFD